MGSFFQSLILTIAITLVAGSVRAENLLKDPTFENGLVSIDTKYHIVETEEIRSINGIQCPVNKHIAPIDQNNVFLATNNNTSTPAWNLAQWDSRAQLLPHHRIASKSGVFVWNQWYKQVIIGTPGSGRKIVTLKINGSREHEGSWNTLSNNPCVERRHPHLVLQQVPKTPNWSQLKHLWFEFNARITNDFLSESFSKGWNPEATTAHLVFHLNLQALRNDRDFSEGHGDSFGIGINLFDVRNGDVYKEKAFIHKPQERVILYLDPDKDNPGFTHQLHAGGWAKIRVDLKPQILKAFHLAKRMGRQPASFVAPIESNYLHQFNINSFYLGWEVSSLHDVGVHIESIKLDAEY